MPEPSSNAPFKRRSLFKVAGLGAAGAAGLPIIAACSDIESGGGTAQSTEGFDFLPTYKEWPLPVEPDLVGEPPNHPSGFTSYPEPIEAVTELPSGSGTYEFTVPIWGDTPSGDDPYYAAVTEAWGGTTINLRQADGNTYADTSVQWLKANEYGDAILMFSWMLGSHTDFRETVVNNFYDLTDIVKGDISERWPLLAGMPNSSWGQSVWSKDPADPDSARIFGIPGNLSGGQGNAVFVRTDYLEAENLAMPTTVEELLEVCRAWSDDANGKWAFGTLDWFVGQWFSADDTEGWLWDADQEKMIHSCELPTFTEMLTFRRTLWDEKLIHPDAPTGTLDYHALQASGAVLFTQDSMGWWGEFVRQVNAGEIDGAIAPLPPLAANGRTPIVPMNTSVDGWTFLNKDLSKEQVEEILDVANWCSSPYGTTEYELMQYGVEGEHFNLGEDGTPVMTELGSKIVGAPVNYKALSGQVQTFLTGDPAMVQARFDYNASIQQYAGTNLFEGMRVEGPADFKAAAQTLWDQQNDIAYGRAELSSIPDMVETFMSNGGEAAREYYTEAYKSIQDK
jgi:putative aldouronate transport system substrate-binding protein